MKHVCNLVRGRLTLETSTVGPKHDPYDRRVVTLCNREGHKMWTLRVCALAGVEFTYYDPASGAAIVFPEKSLKPDTIERLTGMDMKFWDDKVWYYKERALLSRIGMSAYIDYLNFLEADSRLMRYAH